MVATMASSLDFFQARRQRVGVVMAWLAIGVYSLLAIIYVYRLIQGFTFNRVTDLLFMLVCLGANAAGLVWQRQGHSTRSAITYLLANSVVLVVFVITSANTNALVGLVLALGMAAYASAALPRRRVALGTLYGFCSGAFVAALDYIQPWKRGRLNLNLTDPAQIVLIVLGVVFGILLLRLYRGIPLNAKLLLAGSGTALVGAVTTLPVNLPELLSQVSTLLARGGDGAGG